MPDTQRDRDDLSDAGWRQVLATENRGHFVFDVELLEKDADQLARPLGASR